MIYGSPVASVASFPAKNAEHFPFAEQKEQKKDRPRSNPLSSPQTTTIRGASVISKVPNCCYEFDEFGVYKLIALHLRKPK